MKLFLGSARKSILGPTKTTQDFFNKLNFWYIGWSWWPTCFSQFVQSFLQNDEVGAECQCQVFMIAWLSVWPIYRITAELVSKKWKNQKMDKKQRWGSVCSCLWGILKPWVLMRGFSTIIAASLCFGDDFRTASKSTQIPNKDPQKRRSKFLVNYIFLWQDWRVAVNRICHNNLGHTITYSHYSRICGA